MIHLLFKKKKFDSTWVELLWQRSEVVQNKCVPQLSFVTPNQMFFSCVPLRERQIKCPKCDKLFLRTNHLKKHLNSHEGKRDYVCEKCTKAYLTKYHLTRHLKTCKGPTSSSSAQEEEEEDDSEEEELADPVGAEGCRVSSAVYPADEALSTHKWKEKEPAVSDGKYKREKHTWPVIHYRAFYIK